MGRSGIGTFGRTLLAAGVIALLPLGLGCERERPTEPNDATGEPSTEARNGEQRSPAEVLLDRASPGAADQLDGVREGARERDEAIDQATRDGLLDP